MSIKVEIYSCYEKTYKPIINNVLSLLYCRQFSECDYVLEIKDTSDGGRKNIQAQRRVNNNSIYKGRIISVFENNQLKHIVGVSNTNYDEDREYEFRQGKSNKDVSQYGCGNYHANTYLLQGINQIFKYYFDNKTSADLSFYLLDLDKGQNYPNNLFNALSYRELETIGFRVLNKSDVDFSEYKTQCRSQINTNNLKFPSFNKFLVDIAHISKKNSGNTPSFLQCDEKEVLGEDGESAYLTEKYTYTFKALSAQAYDSLLRCWCLKVLADQEGTDIEFKLGKQYFAYDLEERRISDSLTGPVVEIFRLANLNIEYTTNEQFMDEKAKADNTYLRYKSDDNIRNQTLFRNNIRRKGIPCECAVCGESDSKLLDAAHLWEINSIKASPLREINEFVKTNKIAEIIEKSSEYSAEFFYKKYYLANSGDNGVWLCKLHHKMFDLNYYCFDALYGNFLLEFPTQEATLKFKEAQKQDNLPTEILTPLTKAFLGKRQIAFSA